MDCYLTSRRIRRAAARSLLGLFALLPYLLLPLLFYGHLANVSPPAALGANPVRPVITQDHAGKTPASPHDPNTCPICRAAESYQDYAGGLSLPALDLSHLADRTSDYAPTAASGHGHHVASGPRSPPVSL